MKTKINFRAVNGQKLTPVQKLSAWILGIRLKHKWKHDAEFRARVQTTVEKDLKGALKKSRKAYNKNIID